MKLFKNTKIPISAALILVLMTYTHCTGPTGKSKKSTLQFETEESTLENKTQGTQIIASDFEEYSIKSFASTLHPVTYARCKSCHGSFQQPLHALEDTEKAYQAVMGSNKVKFTNPSQSRLVLKLKDSKHNCWSNCDDNAKEILDAIIAWKELRDNYAEENGNQTITQGSDLKNLTEESDALEIELTKENASSASEKLLLAEAANLKLPMKYMPSSINGYIAVTSSGQNKNFNDQSAGAAYFNFDIGESGYYRIYAYVDAPTNNDNSFWIKAGDNGYAQWHIDTTKGFQWHEVTHTTAKNEYLFFAGKGIGHILEVRQREDGTKLSKLIISNNPNINLEEISENARSTITFSLDGIIPDGNATFSIDIEEFDDYSYKFSNPTLKTQSSLIIKNIKILMNGEYNIQHSTYTLVDETVLPGTTILSKRSLIALKEKGSDLDKISISFELLQKR